MCAADAGGLGVALKVEDGSHRPTRPALHAFFGRLGLELAAEFARVPVRERARRGRRRVVCVEREKTSSDS